MLSLPLPGKGVREPAREIHCTQSCPRKREEEGKKRRGGGFSPPGTAGVGYSCCTGQVAHRQGPKQMLKSNKGNCLDKVQGCLGEEQGTVGRSGFIFNAVIHVTLMTSRNML